MDKILGKKILDRINLISISETGKISVKIINALYTEKKYVFISSVLNKDNFYKYGFKNITEAFESVLSEKVVFDFYPFFKLKEIQYDSDSETVIDFDIAITFRKEFIPDHGKDYKEKLDLIVNEINSNNKSIPVYFLYKLIKTKHEFFYPWKLFLEKILNNMSIGISVEVALNFIYNIAKDKLDKTIIEKMIEDFFRFDKDEKSICFTNIYSNDNYFNRYIIDQMVEYRLSNKDVDVMFLSADTKINDKYEIFYDDLINQVSEIFNENENIKKTIKNSIPYDQFTEFAKINRSNVVFLMTVLTDADIFPKLILGEELEREIQAINKYLKENNELIIKYNDPASKSIFGELETLTLEALLDFYKSNSIIERLKSGKTISFTYNNFFDIITKIVEKDKTMIQRVFNSRIRNRSCIFKYLKIEESGGISLSDAPLTDEIIVIPYSQIKRTANFIIKSNVLILVNVKTEIEIFHKILKNIYEKPITFGLNIDLFESVQKTGFLNREDFEFSMNLIESILSDLNHLAVIVSALENEKNSLHEYKINGIFNIFNIITKTFSIYFRNKDLEKNVKIINNKIKMKFRENENMENKFKKEFVKDQTKNDSGRINKLIENLDDEPRKLFTKIYNAIKEKKTVEYKLIDKNLKLEILILDYGEEKSAQMFIHSYDALVNISNAGLIEMDKKYIYLSKKTKGI